MTPLAVAALRGVVAAAVVAGLAFFTGLGLGQDLRTAGIQAGAAGFGVLVVRFGGEGVIDQVRLRSLPPPAPLPGSFGGPVESPHGGPSTGRQA